MKKPLCWVIAAPALVLLHPAAASAAACASPSVTSSPVTTWGPDSAGTSHVDGVLTNAGAAASSVEVHYSYVSAAGAVLLRETATPTLQSLGHGEAQAWDGAVRTTVPAGGHWRVDAIDASAATSAISHAFPVTITTQTPQSMGGPGELRGTVVNDSGVPAMYVELSATLRKADGSLAFVAIGQTQDFLGASVLAPGATADWNIVLDAKAPTWATASVVGEGSDLVVTGECGAAATASIAGVAIPSTRPPANGTLGQAPVLASAAVAPTSPLPDTRVRETRTPGQALGGSDASPTASVTRHHWGRWGLEAGAGLLVLVVLYLVWAVRFGRRQQQAH